MHHRGLLISSILAGGLLVGAGALAAEPEQAWQATGLDAPESVVFDADAGVFYVSNVNGEANAADGNGYISKLSLQGEIEEKEWVTGLNAPKGLALHDGMLYVSDIDELVVISLTSWPRKRSRLASSGAPAVAQATASCHGCTGSQRTCYIATGGSSGVNWTPTRVAESTTGSPMRTTRRHEWATRLTALSWPEHSPSCRLGS